MKHFPLLQDIQFADTHSFSEALLADENHRILRFALKPKQTVSEHHSPHSAVVLVVLSGSGVFIGGDGKAVTLSENSLVVFEPGEMHAIRALDQELVFLAMLQGVAVPHVPVGTMA